MLAAERFTAAPSAESLRGLFAALGGTEGLTMGTTVGVHSTITFDPSDPNIALATLSNGSADQTDVWSISAAGISVAPYGSDVELDDARFNRDGTIIAFEPNVLVGARTQRALDDAVQTIGNGRLVFRHPAGLDGQRPGRALHLVWQLAQGNQLGL